MKTKTLEQVERMKDKAVRFVRDVLADDERADEIDAESVDAYADRKRIQITNPQKAGNRHMNQPSRAKLLERIDELETENQELQDKLDAVADVINDGDEEEDEDDADDGEED